MEPLTPFDLRPGLSPRELLEQMARASFGARSLGHAWRVLRGVLDDPECSVLLTVSGALSVAQLGGIFHAMLIRNILHAVVTTGAVVTHQLVQELQLRQFHLPAGVNDSSLTQQRIHRIHDSLELEANLEALAEFVAKASSEFTGPLGSAGLIRRLANALPNHAGWLAASALQHVPVFAPALTDSELGLALYTNCGRSQQRRFYFDPMVDLDDFAEWMLRQERIALITLGGGVPRNWAMQMLPYLRSQREPKLPRVVAGIRICPDPTAYGHLSGSTYSEATTWGKLDAQDLPNFAEVLGDATIVFPVLMLAAFDAIEKSATRKPSG